MKQWLTRYYMAVLLGIFILSGCSITANNARPSGGSGSNLLAPFIQFNGITYLAVHTLQERPIQSGDLGSEFATVQRTFADERFIKPGYQFRDGDAAYLAPGTTVFTVNEYDPRFRLAAWQDEQLILFEADTNPTAQRGADLLDIGGKVAYIGINSASDGITELARINDQQLITNLVDMILRAPVDHQSRTHSDNDERYFIVFYLTDGTRVSRAYWPNSGELSRGIMLPPEFSTAVQSAVLKQ